MTLTPTSIVNINLTLTEVQQVYQMLTENYGRKDGVDIPTLKGILIEATGRAALNATRLPPPPPPPMPVRKP